jgi:hypothetical protein
LPPILRPSGGYTCLTATQFVPLRIIVSPTLPGVNANIFSHYVAVLGIPIEQNQRSSRDRSRLLVNMVTGSAEVGLKHGLARWLETDFVSMARGVVLLPRGVMRSGVRPAAPRAFTPRRGSYSNGIAPSASCSAPRAGGSPRPRLLRLLIVPISRRPMAPAGSLRQR